MNDARFESQLLDRLRAGDEDGYETLVRTYGGRMLAIARRYFACEQDAADAVQDAFISAFRSIHAFAATSSLSTWLHRITINACLMMLRTRSRRDEVPMDDLLPQFDGDGHHLHPIPPGEETFARVALAENRDAVRACIRSLPEMYRTVLLLRDIEELDTEQAAAALNTTPGNVKTRLHRARQLLRAVLEREFRNDAPPLRGTGYQPVNSDASCAAAGVA